VFLELLGEGNLVWVGGVWVGGVIMELCQKGDIGVEKGGYVKKKSAQAYLKNTAQGDGTSSHHRNDDL